MHSKIITKRQFSQKWIHLETKRKELLLKMISWTIYWVKITLHRSLLILTFIPNLAIVELGASVTSLHQDKEPKNSRNPLTTQVEIILKRLYLLTTVNNKIKKVIHRLIIKELQAKTINKTNPNKLIFLLLKNHQAFWDFKDLTNKN